MKRPERPRHRSARRLYETSRIRRVRLVPDEAVFASCKSHSTAGPEGSIRNRTPHSQPCSRNAS